MLYQVREVEASEFCKNGIILLANGIHIESEKKWNTSLIVWNQCPIKLQLK
jgi:hypothetical protein